MRPVVFAFFELSNAAVTSCIAGIALLAIGLWGARNEIARDRGLNKLSAFATVCFAAPLAVFGSQHFSLTNGLLNMVPKYMPWRMVWIYFVGAALIAASLSIATRIQMRWSGLLVGMMMFLFVAMLYFPSAIRTGNRITWTIVFREMSFGAGGWLLAATAWGTQGRKLIFIGRLMVAMTAIFFGVQHFLHPHALPVVPLQKQMPAWLPASALIDYLTGAFLVAAGLCFLLAQRTARIAAYLSLWILLMIAAIYLPVMVGAFADPSSDVKLEGVNYFFDTLLFAGVILALARASAAPAVSDAA
jgi:uncharacterized membrane protein